jgi:hypothetical protein
MAVGAWSFEMSKAKQKLGTYQGRRYLVFTFVEFYPGGGWDDLAGTFDTIEQARAEAEKIPASGSFTQIIDTWDPKVFELKGER